ncbi:tRNA (5-methylaminomethyl-2-thiouridine)(34)-methyltransferase MnmD [Owenweeksia hongkongensis]|uniref:tRNA (5-methylaminomethyl-2-thiouridine)(34)-methyltransferase MnmD n=1 Tax=Owenweeksia hongkongensis TaxID=253245 RepID=UPI003A909DF4
MNREIVQTNDSSSTLYVPGLEQHYHSMHGAMQESMHVFIDAGFRLFESTDKPVHILEIGFGTALNALLTYFEAKKLNLKVDYTALEKYPLSMDEMLLLNYGSLLDTKEAKRILTDLHQIKWEEKIEVTDFFSLRKFETDIKTYSTKEEYDLIYFDAFAPSAQPDLWSLEVFEHMYASLKPGGTLVTYCVKGDVRRTMKAAGFEVEKIPGPPGKREMARARKA